MPNWSIEHYKNVWHNIQSSLWFLPTTLGIAAVILSYILPSVDKNLPRQIAAHRGWLFYGSPSAARTILSTLAGSLITVIALLFSITMLTLQQASTQFTSRVFQNFTDDRGNQWVLGTYIATFVYCIMILRKVQSANGTVANFVPVLSITVAIVLALICIGLLVFFVHHSATLFQAATVIERIHHDLIDSIERNFQDDDGEPRSSDDDMRAFRELYPEEPRQRIHSQESGYLRTIDEDAVLAALPAGGWGVIPLALGQYVVQKSVLLEVGAAIEDEVRIRQIRTAFVLDNERTLPQDTLFGVRQLVDIAVKALSPGINDPTTAEHVISCLSDAVVRLGDRAFPSRILHEERDQQQGAVALWLNRPTFDDFVAAAFTQIRRVAANDVSVTLHLLAMLQAAGGHLTERNAAPIREQIAHIVTQVDRSEIGLEARAALLAAAQAAEEATRSVPLRAVE